MASKDYKVIGFDIGTGNILSASNESNILSMRDVFISVSQEDISSAELASTNLDYITQKDSDGNVVFNAIVGEDAFKFANVFGQSVKRPMKQGVISSSEIDAIDILTAMCKKLSGDVKDGLCVFSIPAPAIDVEMPPVEYHEKVFTKIFQKIGFTNIKSLNEGASIVFSECVDTNFTGFGVTFGAGLVNVAFVYKGAVVLKFSIGRSGDWIDESVAKSLNMIPNRVTSIKEKEFSLLDPYTGNKKTQRVREALFFYYQSLIDYVIKHFMNEIMKTDDYFELDLKIPIVLSGGTSKPEGFKELFENRFKELCSKDFPYEISEIRIAEDPLISTVKGCLVYAMWLNDTKK